MIQKKKVCTCGAYPPAGFPPAHNQRVLCITKAGSRATFRDLSSSAMLSLGDSAIRLWLYLMVQKDTKGLYNFPLSSVDVGRVTGLSRSSYSRSVKELLEKRFLVEAGDNRYDFTGMSIDK